MNPSDPRWKASVGDDPGPDPLTYKAFLSEFKMGAQAAQDHADQALRETGTNPASLEINFEPEARAKLVAGADEVIDLMKRITTVAKGGSVGVQSERFVAKLSGSLSKLMYNLGKAHGYKEAAK